MTKQIANFFKSCLKAVFLTACFSALFFDTQGLAQALPGGSLNYDKVTKSCTALPCKPPSIVTTTGNTTTATAPATATRPGTVNVTDNTTGVTTVTTGATTATGIKAENAAPAKENNFPSLPTDAKDVKFITAQSTPGGGFTDCPNLDQIRAQGLSSNGLLEKCGRQIITFVAVLGVFGLVFRISLIGFAMLAPGGKDETAQIKMLISDVVIGLLLVGGFAMFLNIINSGVFKTSGLLNLASLNQKSPTGGTGTGNTGGAGTSGNGNTGDTTTPANNPVKYTGNGTYTKNTLKNAVEVASDPKATPEEKAKALGEVRDFALIKNDCSKSILPTGSVSACEAILNTTEKSILDAIKSLESLGNFPIADKDPIISVGNVDFNMRRLEITGARTRENFASNTATDPNVLPKQNWELQIKFEPKIAGDVAKTARIYLENCQDTLLGGKGVPGQLDMTDTYSAGAIVKARYYNPRVMIGKIFGPEVMRELTNSTTCNTIFQDETSTDMKLVDWK